MAKIDATQPIVIGVEHTPENLPLAIQTLRALHKLGVRSIGIENQRPFWRKTLERFCKSRRCSPQFAACIQKLQTNAPEKLDIQPPYGTPFFQPLAEQAKKMEMEVFTLEGILGQEAAVRFALQTMNSEFSPSIQKKIEENGFWETFYKYLQKFPASYFLINARDRQMTERITRKKPGAVFVGNGHADALRLELGIPSQNYWVIKNRGIVSAASQQFQIGPSETALRFRRLVNAEEREKHSRKHLRRQNSQK